MQTTTTSPVFMPKRLALSLKNLDPRATIAILLFAYLVFGFTILGFNRTPMQALVTTLTTCGIEVLFCRLFRGKWIMPLSALITSLSLSILLNYSHNYFILFVPAFFAIAGKYVFTFNDRHLYNPAQFAVTMSLIFASTLITSAPAYQWTGISSMGAFIAGFGIFLLVPKVNRFPLVGSFLFFFTLQILFRAWLMKHHLPFVTLFFGTITSPAFFLFTFFMITDPATSPKDTKGQIIAGFLLALFDLIFHLRQSYHTFFFAGFTVQTLRLLQLHGKAILAEKKILPYFKARFLGGGYYKRLLFFVLIIILALAVYHKVIAPQVRNVEPGFTFTEINSQDSGFSATLGTTLTRVDPRIQHISKWLLSVGDSASLGDFDNDGLLDVFFSYPLKVDADRNALYKNLGNFKFQRVPLPMIEEKTRDMEKYGLGSNGVFVDIDNDHDLDLLITYAFGRPILLRNQLAQTGTFQFVDDTQKLGLDLYTNSIAANFLDINKDGRLDLIIGNVWPKELPDYPKNSPEELNLFRLPKEQYEGDVRMFNFMHSSWNLADNGGVNDVLMQQEDGSFKRVSSEEMGMPEHFWTLAIGTADFNQDGWTDLYMANDFGPDNLYYNREGKKFEKIEGEIFGSIGKDTYKGMNASIADLDRNGWMDVYISNVHHELQAEGSLLWMFGPNSDDPGSFYPDLQEDATKRGALNEDRFGWGGALVDFNNDGWVDIAQANGMVDDVADKKFEKCPDYWYVNEKIARSPPSIHRYIHNWGDIRGFCIYGQEKNRLYLNMGGERGNFIDVADQVGMQEATNSRGTAAGDLDNDGDLDLIVTHQFKVATLYKNEMDHKSGGRNFIAFALDSKNKECNSQGIGSMVALKFKNEKGEIKTHFHEAQLVSGFSAQNDTRIHFGLGLVREILDVEVNWCQKIKKSYGALSVNRYHDLVLSSDKF